MEVIREHWISLDKCPSCNSKKTFHSEWMKREELQKISTVNSFRVEWAGTSPRDQITDNQEGVFSKRDLCLKCGHTWVMFVQHVKLDKLEEDGTTRSKVGHSHSHIY